MVVGVARVALAGLLLMASSVPVEADPAAGVAVWPSGSGQEACHHAEAAGVDLLTGCLNVGPVAGPLVPTHEESLDGDDVPSATPAGDVRTSTLTLLDVQGSALGEAGLDLGEDEVTYLWTERDGELWCVHLLEGAPLQPDGPAQSACVRGDPRVPSAGPVQWTDEEGFPLLYEARFAYGTNPVRYAAGELAPVHVTATVTFTYDCTQMGTQLLSVLGDTVEVYSPAYPLGGTLADGALGLAASADELAAVFEVMVEDEAGEVASTRTTLPGMGHAIGYALFMEKEQAGGHSPLCD